MDQALRLAFDRLHHLRMAVAGGRHRDAGVEIEEPVSVDVFDHGAFAARGHQWITTRVRWRKNLGVALDHLGGARAGQRHQNMRKVQTNQFFGKHFNLLLFSYWLGKRPQRRELVGAEQAGAGCCRSRHKLSFIVAI